MPPHNIQICSLPFPATHNFITLSQTKICVIWYLIKQLAPSNFLFSNTHIYLPSHFLYFQRVGLPHTWHADLLVPRVIELECSENWSRSPHRRLFTSSYLNLVVLNSHNLIVVLQTWSLSLGPSFLMLLSTYPEVLISRQQTILRIVSKHLLRQLHPPIPEAHPFICR